MFGLKKDKESSEDKGTGDYNGKGIETKRACRHWVFTSYHESKPIFDREDMNYMVFQPEKCPTTGKHHFQGYVEFKMPKRPKGACVSITGEKKYKAHVEERKGTFHEASIYCKKPQNCKNFKAFFKQWEKTPEIINIDKQWEEFGEHISQGQRNDLLADGLQAIKDKSLINVGITNAIRYGRGIEKVISIHAFTERRDDERTDLKIFWGPAGTGKTIAVEETYPKGIRYNKAAGMWWENYKQEEIVFMDEFNPAKFDVNVLLKLADKGQLTVDVKGSSREFNSKRIIICCHFNPKTWYPERWDEIKRRCSSILRFSKDNIHIYDKATKKYKLSTLINPGIKHKNNSIDEEAF